MILALETATNICSVSFRDAHGKIHEKRTERKGSHSEYLFLFIRDLMEEHNFRVSDLNAVLVSNGPGSYTGLRIAASSVKGLLFDQDVPVFAANTLAGFAQGVKEKAGKNSIHAVINARRTHLYYQQFWDSAGLQSDKKPQILDLKIIEERIKSGDLLIGTGIERLSESIRTSTRIFDQDSIKADSLITLFESESGRQYFTETTAEELESNYVSSSQV